jgi:hypothetical protein
LSVQEFHGGTPPCIKLSRHCPFQPANSNKLQGWEGWQPYPNSHFCLTLSHKKDRRLHTWALTIAATSDACYILSHGNGDMLEKHSISGQSSLFCMSFGNPFLGPLNNQFNTAMCPSDVRKAKAHIVGVLFILSHSTNQPFPQIRMHTGYVCINIRFASRYQHLGEVRPVTLILGWAWHPPDLT